MAEELVNVFAQLTGQINLLSTAFREEGVLARIDKFKGDYKRFKSWIREIEKAARICGYNDHQKKLLAYQTAEGRVGDYIERYMETNAEATWVVFKAELRDRFGEFIDPHLALSRLRETKMEKGESVQVYAERLLAHARDAFHDQPGGLGAMQMQLVAYFEDGLPDKIRLKVMRDNPATLNEAIVSARNEQALQTRFALRGRGQGQTTTPRPPPQQQPRREVPMEVDQTKFKARCFVCGKYGHRQKDCRSKQQKVNMIQVGQGNAPEGDQAATGGGPQNVRQRGLEGQPPRQCWSCGEAGHFKRDCPKRKRAPVKQVGAAEANNQGK